MEGRRLLVIMLVIVSVSATCAGFFLPWARIELKGSERKELGRIALRIRRGAETLTGDLPTLSDIPRKVSGAQIPRLANQKNSQLLLALVELATNTRQEVGLKSYAVYLLPSLALLSGLLLIFLDERRLIVILVGLFCAALSAFGFWRLLTLKTTTPFASITIGHGLWLSLWGYVGLAMSACYASLPNCSSRASSLT
jgi:hypothetical protein